MGAQGPNMRRLRHYVEGAKPDNVLERVEEWRSIATEFATTTGDLNDVAKMFSKAFHDTSLVTQTGTHALKGAADDLEKKQKELNEAIEGLTTAAARVAKAKQAHAQLVASLPASHGAPPSTSDPAYNTSAKNIPTDEVARRSSAFNSAMSSWKADEAAIAHAETQAYHHITQVDDGNQTAQPPVRKISQDPDKESSNATGSSAATGGYENSGQPPAYASPGSRSAIAHSKAIIEATNANSHYADGMGYDIIAHHKDLIAQAHEANVPEWDPSQGMWVNADGSPADSSQYAAVETDGVLKGVGGGFGMGAVAFGVGGVAVGGGIAMALKARFGTAAAAVSGMKGQASVPRTNLAGAGSRAGAAGKAAAGSASKAGGANRAGGRGAGSRGAGAGGRGGRKNKKGAKGKSTEYLADYSDDWVDDQDDVYSDETYQRLMEKKRREDS